jgi:polysaccharide pyruvyl transferase WcaK-like protein
MTLRGAVFGWYHKRNAGDDRLAHCIENWLSGHELLFLPHTSSPPIELLQQVDYVILGGGSIANEVHGVFKDMRHWIQAAQVPVFGVSLTVSHFDEFRYELSSIPETGGMIWVRDPKSAEVLGFDRDLVVAPDISWLFPRTFSHEVRSDDVGINFRPWSKINWQPKVWEPQLSHIFGDKLTPWPLCFGKDDDLSILRQVMTIKDYPNEFDPTVPSRSQLIIAMRYHAIVFAIQAGTPFIAIKNTRKLQYLLEQIGLSYAAVPLDQPNQLPQVLKLVDSSVTSELLAQVTQKMSNQAWEVANLMRERIETTARANRNRKKKFSVKITQKYSRLKTLIR